MSNSNSPLFNCAQPNCSGMIEDGYCNICGMSAPKSSAAPKQPSSLNKTGILANDLSRNMSSTNSGLLSRRSGLGALGGVGTGISSSVTGSSSKGTRRSGVSSRSTRKKLGAGLITLPDLPSTAPEEMLLAEAVVPENKRFCSNCNQALKREFGFCPKCGVKFSFVSSLKPGDRVAGQYEVKGAIAFGGLGWVYLGFDLTLSRYVVLKGLLNTEDASSAAVAVAEKQFLASVKHSNIVGIYNFVNHGGEGFIVMEYVGGKTLKDIRKERGILPVAEAIAYIHRVLGAFSYLHAQGLVYCDFKLDNMIIEGDDIKLIDLGGVRRIDDPDGDIYGTIGYTAPEAGEGPTVVTDLYTVARTLLILVCAVKGFTKESQYKLPTPQDEPLFGQQESLYRFLLRATATDPNARFQSADEMADQLLGVLREVVANDRNSPCPSTSSLFSGDRLSYLIKGALDPILVDAQQVPLALMDQNDVALREIVGAMVITDTQQRSERLAEITKQYPQSTGAQLQSVDFWFTPELSSKIEPLLQIVEKIDPWEWRVTWNRGRIALLNGKSKDAIVHFDRVYTDLPGELAPQLALALALEQNKDYSEAIFYYQRVLQTNPDYPTAAFGRARCHMALQSKELGQRDAAVSALNQIPPTSSLYLRSQAQAIQTWANDDHTSPNIQDLVAASHIMEQLSLQGLERYQLMYALFNNALQIVQKNPQMATSTTKVMNRPLTKSEMQMGLESVLRSMAHLSEGDEKIRLVDEANRVRPMSSR